MDTSACSVRSILYDPDKDVTPINRVPQAGLTPLDRSRHVSGRNML